MSTPRTVDPGDLAARVAAVDWYHTIELPGGLVTPGHFDTRTAVPRVPMPASLRGMRCLDVGTWDGFWAFEMERRGAAEVVAVDLEDQRQWDWPPEARLKQDQGGLDYLEHVKSGDRGFDIARGALGSKVRRISRSVYDLGPEELGTFDFCFVGSLLLHLRDPVRALDRVRTVCSGQAVICELIEVGSSVLHPRTPMARLEGMGEPWWWQPNAAAIRRMAESAGWEVVERRGPFIVRTGTSHARPPLRELLRSLRTTRDRERAFVRVLGGLPHVALRVVPRG